MSGRKASVKIRIPKRSPAHLSGGLFILLWQKKCSGICGNMDKLTQVSMKRCYKVKFCPFIRRNARADIFAGRK